MSAATRPTLLPAAAAAWVLAAAGCGDAPSIEPPQILYGQDVCAECGMIISDDRFAAGLVLSSDGGFTTRAFDDIGCLLAWEQAHPAETVAARYVADLRTRTWLDAATAAYLHSRRLHTPMAFGLAALATEAEARAAAAEYPGDVIDFPAVRERFDAGRLTIFPDEDT
jgi:copper chaperone NosL